MQLKPHNRVGAAVALWLCAGCTAPFGLEYENTYLAGRVHNPTPDVVYQVGDTNGNGLIDENEQPAPPRIEQESAGSTIASTPQGASSSNTLMHGFLDVGDGVLDGDGFADDIGRSGQSSPQGSVLVPFDPVPDTRIGGLNSNDFGDLVTLPTSFNSLFLGSWVQSQDLELLQVHRFEALVFDRPEERSRFAIRPPGEEGTTRDTELEETKEPQPDTFVELGYGARFHIRDDRQRLRASGGVLGNSYWNTTIDNQAVGPVITASVGVDRDGWTITAGGSVGAAYNDGDGEQAVGIGEDLVLRGQFNSPLFFDPTYSRNNDSEQNFTFITDFSAEARYQIRPGLSAGVSYYAFFLSAVRHAEDQIDYTLPNMGFINGGTDDLIMQTALASIEYRR